MRKLRRRPQPKALLTGKHRFVPTPEALGLSSFTASWFPLESRIMFDGAAVATEHTVTTHVAVQQTESPASTNYAASEMVVSAPIGEPQLTATDHALVAALLAADTSAARHEIVFVAPSVRGYQDLLDSISAHVEVVVLDQARDGVEQMAEVLTTRNGIDAIHLISHGSEGQVDLGSAYLTHDSLMTLYTDELSIIRDALSEQGDILIYGCEVAVGERGQAFVDALSQATSADVAASRDNTGSAALGGDWALEYRTGMIDVQTIEARSYEYLLAPPNVDLNGGAAGTDVTRAFTEQTPVQIAPAATVTDADSNVASMTVTLTARPNGNTVESLSLNTAATTAATTSGLTVTYTNTTGVLSITGSAAPAVYQTILRGILYNNTSDAPITTSRSITVVTNDGSLSSSLRTATINITAVNDAPVVDLNGAAAGTTVTTAFTEQTPVRIAPVGTVVDPDSNLVSMTVTLTARPNGNTVESLSLNAAATTAASGAGLTVTYTNTTGVLLITGSATPSVYQTILQGIQYNNTSDTPNTTNRSITVVTNDGSLSSTSRTATITLAAVNDAPTATITPTTYTATEQIARTLHGTGLSIADVDAGTAGVRATVSVTSGILTAGAGTTGVTITGSGTGTVTLNGTLTQINNLLAGALGGTLTYMANSDAPPASATLTLTASDLGNTGTGGTLTGSDTATINITAVNDAPVLTGDLSATVNEGSSYVLTTGDLGFTDPDDGAADVTFTVSGLTNGTVRVGGLSVTSFTGTQLANGDVSFQHDESETTSASFLVNVEDGNEDSSTPVNSIFNFTVNPMNDTPVAVADAATVAEGGTVSVLTGGATSVLTNDSDLDLPGDILSAILVSGPTHGSLTLNGNGTFSYTHNGSETTNDSFTYKVNDGTVDGNTVTVNLAIMPVNDAPVLMGDLSANVNEGSSYVLTTGDLGFTDPDDVAASVTFTVSGLTNGTVLVGGTASTTFTGTQLVNGDVSFQHDGSETTSASFLVNVEDGNEDNSVPVNSTFTVTVNPVNDAPVITSNGGGAAAAVSVVENQTSVTTVTSSDVDGGTPSYTIVGGADATLFTINSATGVLTFVTAPNFEAPIDVDHDNVYDVIVQVNDGAGVATQALAVTVTDINETSSSAVAFPPILAMHGEPKPIPDLPSGLGIWRETLLRPEVGQGIPAHNAPWIYDHLERATWLETGKFYTSTPLGAVHEVWSFSVPSGVGSYPIDLERLNGRDLLDHQSSDVRVQGTDRTKPDGVLIDQLDTTSQMGQTEVVSTVGYRLFGEETQSAFQPTRPRIERLTARPASPLDDAPTAVESDGAMSDVMKGVLVVTGLVAVPTVAWLMSQFKHPRKLS